MRLIGSFTCPGDKSISHRIALLSLLARGECQIQNYSPAEDTACTLEAIRALGGEVLSEDDVLVIRGREGDLARNVRIDCANSGTTMRLLMGILSGVSGDYILDGDASLRRRPMERVASPLRSMGAEVKCADGKPPVSVRGGSLVGIDYELPVPSAQLKSAVLLAGLRARGVTTVVEPVKCRDHTERLLKHCGAKISGSQDCWRIERSTPVLPGAFHVPGDISSAAFLICAALIIPESELVSEQILLNETRIGFFEVLRRMGARIEIEYHGEIPEPWGSVRARFSPKLSGCEIYAHEVPALVDEVPILALVATQARGETIFHKVGELRVKESDRLEAIVTQLGAMGARIRAKEDELEVQGPTTLRIPGHLKSFADHRIAMTLRLACLLADGDATIEGEESTRISFPGFHETLKGLLR